MACAFVTSFLGCVVTIFLFCCAMGFGKFTFLSKALLLIFSIFIGCIPLFISYSSEKYLGKFFVPCRYALYFIFVLCIIWFCLCIILSVFSLVTIIPAFKHFRSYFFNIFIVAFFISFLLALYSLFEGMKVPAIKNINIKSNKIKNAQTIVLLPDLHIHRAIYKGKIKKIVLSVNNQNPDIIILLGDVFDDDLEKIEDITNELKNLKSKQRIYFVSGNHEAYVGYKESIKKLQNLGFIALDNFGVSINDDLFIGGVKDIFSSKGDINNLDLKDIFKDAKDMQYKILASHTPYEFKGKNNFDLEVSGHTHGGQIFPFHMMIKLTSKYLSGFYKFNDGSRIYISRGAGQWGPQMRFLAPSEITVLKLQSRNQRKDNI